jgi:hypothetical protein
VASVRVEMDVAAVGAVEDEEVAVNVEALQVV